MATGSLSTLMTGISDHRTGGFSGFSEGNCCKVASEKRRLLLRPLFRSKRVLGNVEIKNFILNHLTRSTNLSNQVALIEKAYAKIHGSYEVNINHNKKLTKLKKDALALPSFKSTKFVLSVKSSLIYWQEMLSHLIQRCSKMKNAGN